MRIAIVATDAIRQERIAFTTEDIVRFPLSSQSRAGGSVVATAKGVRLSLAVVASSCFPPVFRRMHLSYKDLGINYNEFREKLSVNDGGVADNLGIEVLLELRASNYLAADLTLIGDAERPQWSQPRNGLDADVAAQSIALSEGARRRAQSELGRECTLIRLSARIPEEVGLSFWNTNPSFEISDGPRHFANVARDPRSHHSRCRCSWSSYWRAAKKRSASAGCCYDNQDSETGKRPG